MRRRTAGAGTLIDRAPGPITTGATEESLTWMGRDATDLLLLELKG